MKEEKCAATLTVHQAGDMSKEGRKAIAEWLRLQAKSIIKDGEKYSKRYTAKYMYFPK